MYCDVHLTYTDYKGGEFDCELMKDFLIGVLEFIAPEMTIANIELGSFVDAACVIKECLGGNTEKCIPDI
jgi:hypothetical protein